VTFRRLGGEVDVVGREVVEDIGVRVDIRVNDVYSLDRGDCPAQGFYCFSYLLDRFVWWLLGEFCSLCEEFVRDP
jgi:hypothetical protein